MYKLEIAEEAQACTMKVADSISASNYSTLVTPLTCLFSQEFVALKHLCFHWKVVHEFRKDCESTIFSGKKNPWKVKKILHTERQNFSFWKPSLPTSYNDFGSKIMTDVADGLPHGGRCDWRTAPGWRHELSFSTGPLKLAPLSVSHSVGNSKRTSSFGLSHRVHVRSTNLYLHVYLEKRRTNRWFQPL